jgi:heparinase II/III-like protein
LSVSNQRIVVDSGVYEYAAGPWRDFFRGTSAHNTVEVAAENQSEVWSSFRVGKRARPGPVFWESGAETVLVQAEHDGYRRLAVPVLHQRTIFSRYHDFWLIVDQLWGNGETSLANHLHLNPDLGFEQIRDHVWRIKNSDVELWLTTFGESTHSLVRGRIRPFRQGWYSEAFGDLRANSVLTLQRQGELPVCFGYAIGREAPAQLNVTSVTSGNEVVIASRGVTHRLRLVRNERPRMT